MSQKKKYRRYSREVKLSAIRRMAAGESASALSRELEVRRVLLYRWRDQYQELGDLAFPGKPGSSGASAPISPRISVDSASI